ncbi:DUF3768 domain-containing protein [Agrobacterium tumefaciens]|uniref:DUF3768 domain-containing protein n=2 Tax=Rhizobiaceae TaxID=82115 RepID=UPI000200D3AC|nr:DUF3768 domain-containing protein [Agrobacterium tumefaciens]ADY67623.1 hypothetical protein AGROH133_14016 [Agrobacterium tumefaciens]NIB57216.1 DUF3768 domain-containing protein [Agrobacterium tumefaciens]NSY72653.1 DUF3768 domain-containing protein [Agrobacterium tumefaciens]NSZ24522.1 DUF3768 domain-containing protein [Agrobacterium tumefaciens]NSZ71241.1 DUF3768 domain-containing protein [Agrobacterium tumefaciens]
MFSIVMPRLVACFVAWKPTYQQAIIVAVQAFDDFSPNNDPYGEHNFGAVTLKDAVFFWKIDYYDLDLQFGSSDPTDDDVTCRVLTVIRADEY